MYTHAPRKLARATSRGLSFCGYGWENAHEREREREKESNQEQEGGSTHAREKAREREKARARKETKRERKCNRKVERAGESSRELLLARSMGILILPSSFWGRIKMPTESKCPFLVEKARASFLWHFF